MPNKLPALLASALTIVCAAPSTAFADPIHATPEGGFWHHDSNWVFANNLAGFALVGHAQDIAGSTNAVAHYAREIHGVRVVVSVQLLSRADDGSAVADELAANAAPLDVRPKLDVRRDGTRYVASSEHWRVLIECESPPAAGDVSKELDAFVRAQRWDTLTQPAG